MTLSASSGLDAAVGFVAGEWMLRSRPNGGTVILLRAGWITLWFFVLAIVAHESLDPTSTLEFSLTSLRRAARDDLGAAAAVFGASYAALYARFSSQWTYLAGLYNQIMAAKVGGVRETEEAKSALASWQAGFIEDAQDLHLATKPMFASVVASFLSCDGVKATFVKYTVDGERRLRELESVISVLCPAPADETQCGTPASEAEEGAQTTKERPAPASTIEPPGDTGRSLPPPSQVSPS